MKNYQRLEKALFYTMDLTGAGIVELRNDWAQLTMKFAKTHYRNGVFLSQISEEDCDERIDEVIQFYNEIGCPFRWVTGPNTRPVHFNEILLRKGFEHFENLEGLTLVPNDFPDDTKSNVIVRSVTLNNFDEWVDITSKGWGFPDAGKERFRNEVKGELSLDNQRCFYFTAFVDGVPLGTSSYLLIDDFMHFNGSVVLEEYRRKGVYRAMLNQRVNEAKDREINLITNHCVQTTSAPICKALGFNHECTFEVYTYKKF